MLYGLQAALEDVDRDLSAARDEQAYREAFNWLRGACEPLGKYWIEPKAI